jgi:hypothetical protein
MEDIGANKLLVINGKPVSRKDLFSFYVKLDDSFKAKEKYYLYALKESCYKHPQAPDHAVIPVLEQEFVGEFIASDPLFPLIKMLFLNHQQIKNSFKNELIALNQTGLNG